MICTLGSDCHGHIVQGMRLSPSMGERLYVVFE